MESGFRDIRYLYEDHKDLVSGETKKYHIFSVVGPKELQLESGDGRVDIEFLYDERMKLAHVRLSHPADEEISRRAPALSELHLEMNGEFKPVAVKLMAPTPSVTALIGDDGSFTKIEFNGEGAEVALDDPRLRNLALRTAIFTADEARLRNNIAPVLESVDRYIRDTNQKGNQYTMEGQASQLGSHHEGGQSHQR